MEAFDGPGMRSSHIVMSHLYGNSLFFGLPDCDIKKLQRVQNAAAKVVQRGRMESTECFTLVAHSYIEHKILTYNSVHGLAPRYM